MGQANRSARAPVLPCCVSTAARTRSSSGRLSPARCRYKLPTCRAAAARVSWVAPSASDASTNTVRRRAAGQCKTQAATHGRARHLAAAPLAYQVAFPSPQTKGRTRARAQSKKIAAGKETAAHALQLPLQLYAAAPRPIIADRRRRAPAPAAGASVACQPAATGCGRACCTPPGLIQPWANLLLNLFVLNSGAESMVQQE
jgi:hypothetical protein